MTVSDSRYDAREYPEAHTRAERFVDDATWLRMTRLRMPTVKTELAGVTSERIKLIHLADAKLEHWMQPPDAGAIVDIAFRFPDGSIAIRIAATQRWEVMRTW